MRISSVFASTMACTSVASAWSMSDSLDSVKSLAAQAESYFHARQDDGNGDTGNSEGGNESSADPSPTPTDEPSQTSESSTIVITDAPQSSSAVQSESNSSSGDNNSKSAAGSATNTKGSSSKTSLSPINPNDPVGGLQMITPAAIAPEQYYKVGQTITWVWNYTSLSRPPQHVDILASYAASAGVAPSPFTLGVNETFEPTQTFTWDTGKYYTSTSPLPIGTYTLIVYDSDATAGISQIPSPGYLGVWEQFRFGMYTPQPPLALENPYICATCNSASSLERMTIGALVATAGMTVASFMWFTGGWRIMI